MNNRILMVDHNKRNIELVADVLQKEGFDVQGCTSMEEFDSAIGSNRRFALALVDIAGFDRSVWERCEQLRGQTPFIVISAKETSAIQKEAAPRGAKGILTKPLSIAQLISLVHSLAMEESA